LGTVELGWAASDKPASGTTREGILREADGSRRVEQRRFEESRGGGEVAGVLWWTAESRQRLCWRHQGDIRCIRSPGRGPWTDEDAMEEEAVGRRRRTTRDDEEDWADYVEERRESRRRSSSSSSSSSGCRQHGERARQCGRRKRRKTRRIEGRRLKCACLLCFALLCSALLCSALPEGLKRRGGGALSGSSG
jgi:hypothetical protein